MVQPPQNGGGSTPSIPGPVTIRYQYRVRRQDVDMDTGETIIKAFGPWRDYDVTNGSETDAMWRKLAESIDNPNIYSVDVHYVGPVTV